MLNDLSFSHHVLSIFLEIHMVFCEKLTLQNAKNPVPFSISTVCEMSKSLLKILLLTSFGQILLNTTSKFPTRNSCLCHFAISPYTAWSHLTILQYTCGFFPYLQQKLCSKIRTPRDFKQALIKLKVVYAKLI